MAAGLSRPTVIVKAGLLGRRAIVFIRPSLSVASDRVALYSVPWAGSFFVNEAPVMHSHCIRSAGGLFCDSEKKEIEKGGTLSTSTARPVGARALDVLRAAPYEHPGLTLVAAIAILAVVSAVFRGSLVAVLAIVILVVLIPGWGASLLTPFPRGSRGIVIRILLSLSWATAVAVGCAWARFTDPVALFALLAAPGLIGAGWRPIVSGLSSRRRLPPTSSRDDRSNYQSIGAQILLWIRTGIAPRALKQPRRPPAGSPPAANAQRRLQTIGLAIVGLSLVAEGAAIIIGKSHVVGTYGLLPALGPLFLLSVIGGLLIAILGAFFWPISPIFGAVGLAIVCFDFTVTPSFFAKVFLGGWNYKHLGVVDLIASGRPLSDPHDLFQQWPGFFAVGADIASISGRGPLDYANLGQVLFQVIAAIGLFCVARQILPKGVWGAYVAVAIYLTMGWEGQIYYSPQSFSYAVEMLLLATVVPLFLRPERRPTRFLFFANWASRGISERPPSPLPHRRLTAIAVLGGCLTILISHQLTPYMFVLQVGVFVALGWVRRDWQIAYVAFVAASLTFLLVHQGALGGGPLLSGFSVSNAQGSVTGLTSHAQQIAAFGARSEALFFWAAAAVAALSYWRKFGQVIVPALFAAMPMGLVAFQNYGGEAIYRVWLFSSPWCAVLIAKRVCDWDKARLVRYLAVVAVCLASFVASAQATIFGMFPMLVMSGSEISGSTWFLDHSPPGTTLVLALSNFPARLNGNYVLHNATNSVNDPILTNSAEFQGSGMERASANQVANFVSTEWGPNSYLVISKSMDTENAYYRTVSPGSLENLEWKLAASPRWAVAYTNGDVTFFRLTGQQ